MYQVTSRYDFWEVFAKGDSRPVATFHSSDQAMSLAFLLAATLNRIGGVERAVYATEILTDDDRAALYTVAELGGKAAPIVPMRRKGATP